MMLITATLLLAVALQANPPVKPAKDLDPQDPQSIADHAIFNTRIQRCYETVYTASLATNIGTIDYKGQSVWVAPGVLYLHYTATGNDEQKVVRVGDKDVWVHNWRYGWATDAEAGKEGVARGIQNPDDVLSILAKHTATGVKPLKPGLLGMTFNGAAIGRMLQGQVPGGINPANSSATVQLEVDEKFRIRKLLLDATVNGANRYKAEVTVVSYNEATEIKFSDEKDKPIPLLPEMRDRIDAVLNGKK
jgi:hypothetical protein